MRVFSKPFLYPTLVIALGLVFAAAGLSQITTGSLSGTVTAREDGSRLPGATVTAVHQPTGTRYTAVTSAEGKFRIPNVRVGGPYTVSVNLDGFQPSEKGDVTVGLGQDVSLSFALELKAVEEVVTVVGESSSLINPSRTGAASNVPEAVIDSLPTISRGLEDFARTNPFISVIPANDEAPQITVAGRNNRYNNIQIDGAVNNDLFGLSDSGTPGGQTQTQPISLDAIQELQFVVAPYDVRQGGFSGGGINAITRSGTNRLTGSAYYYTRDDSLVGNGPKSFPELGTFSEDQYGFRVGGPISKDKIFFFVNGERTRKQEPSGWSIGGTSGQDFGHQAEAQRFRSILMDQYGYDPGGFQETTLPTDSDKAFGRFDFNLSDSQNLTLRHNYIDASIDINRPSAREYQFPNFAHTIKDKTNSTVAQLNSVFGPNIFNEGRLTYQTIKDVRTGETPFPYVNVDLPDGTSLTAGTEQFSTANSLDQDILEITDDVTLLKGNHTLTIGTHNELFKFKNLFIRDFFGSYQFDSLDDFAAGTAFQFDHSFSQTSNPEQPAEFNVNQIGLYAGDSWAARPNLTLTFGLRVDVPYFPDKPSRNPVSEQVFGLRTDVMPSGRALWSPRFGFNWDILGNGKHQLRGGTGIFAGRTPFVWISNQFSNTGIEFGRLQARGAIPFNPDPFNQPEMIGSLFTNEIDLIDPNFDFPTVTRTNLGYDVDLGFWGLVGTVEGIYTKTDKDILYQNKNYAPTGQTAFDGRPILAQVDPSFTDVIFLTNTTKGEQWDAVAKLERPFRNGIYGSVSYAYGRSSVINDATSSQAVSNWRFNEVQGDPNNPTLSTSDFDTGDRFNATLSYQLNWSQRFPATVSLFYNAQAGRPYATTYAFNFLDRATINGDFQTNDLIYVPASEDEVIVTGGTWADLNAYIEADAGLRDARGHIVRRNASRAPWVHELDFRYAQDVSFAGKKVELTFDILNLANLIDSSSGLVRFVNFSAVSPVRFDGIDKATGKPIYHLMPVALNPDQRFQIDDLRSRWQAKLGIRFSF